MSRPPRFWFLAALVLFLCPGRLLLAQTAAPISTSAAADGTDADVLLADFIEQQQSIAQAYNTLLQQGATPQQVQAWQAANATIFQAQQERAIALAAYSAAQPLTYVSEVSIPADASQAMDDFLMTRADLYNRYVELHNQAVANAQAAGRLPSESDMQSAFQSQNAGEFQAQTHRAQIVADLHSEPLVQAASGGADPVSDKSLGRGKDHELS